MRARTYESVRLALMKVKDAIGFSIKLPVESPMITMICELLLLLHWAVPLLIFPICGLEVSENDSNTSFAVPCIVVAESHG